MIELNQLLYSIFAFMAFGLGLSSYVGFKDDKTYFKTQVFWSISIYLFMFSCIFWAIAPTTGFHFLSLASTCLVGSTMATVFLLRSMSNAITKIQLSSALILLIIFGAALEPIRLYEFIEPAILTSLAIVIHLVLLIKQLTALIKTDRSIYLKCMVGLTIIIVALIFSHHYSRPSNPDYSLESIYLEPRATFYGRVAGYSLYLLNFILISLYFYEKAKDQASLMLDLIEEQMDLKEEQMLSVLSSISLAKDSDTGQHILRTQKYVLILAYRLSRMGHYSHQLTHSYFNHLYNAAPLHDIGKVAIPDQILKKPAKLDADEWEIMKTHAMIGEQILATANLALYNKQEKDILSIAMNIAGGHHEKWDGSGYPRGLKGEAIPLEARIMAIADIYDALVCERAYKKSWTHEEATNEIVKHKNSFFDPFIVDAFIAEQLAFKNIAKAYAG